MAADGAAGARRASALLTIAVCAETSYATMMEEGAKIDLLVQFRDAFTRKHLLSCQCQVKSGPSYLSTSKKKRFALTIDKETVNALRATTGPGLLIWVPNLPSRRVHWHVISPHGPVRTPLVLSHDRVITPALRYELTRAAIAGRWTQPTHRLDVANRSATVAKLRARDAYGELQKTWTHPLVGDFMVSRFGWRHITGRARPRAHREQSLLVAPYLAQFLELAPQRYISQIVHTTTIHGRVLEERHIVCWYRGALRISGIAHSLALRFEEEISYPTDWETRPLGDRHVQQRARLAGWWTKETPR